MWNMYYLLLTIAIILKVGHTLNQKQMLIQKEHSLKSYVHVITVEKYSRCREKLVFEETFS